MKINEIIRRRRKELSLTQEQIADSLGVSAPAVSKWEKGSSYPDITLLPALARLLKIDLNTLLSFHDDLSDIEIENFVNEVDKIIQEQGYEAAFQIAVDKIQEYPNSEQLMYSVILYLEGALFLYDVSGREHYEEKFEKFYQRMAVSENAKIKETAIGMLISYKCNRGQFSEAEELIDTLQESSIDKEERRAILYTRQGKYLEAEKIWERRILNKVTEIETALMSIMEIAVREGRSDDAGWYADLYEKVSRQFCQPEWISYSAHLQLAIERQDREKCLSILEKMIPAMREEWRAQETVLYRNLNSGETGVFQKKLMDRICSDLKNKEEFAFIREELPTP